MSKLRIAAVAAVGALATAATPADAAKYERVLVDRFTHPYDFGIDCAEFGPYEFTNLVEGRERVKVTDVLASDGTLLRTVQQSGFVETNTNSQTGRSITLRSATNQVWNYEAGTRTLSGKVFLVTGRGEGVLIQDTGRITMTLDTREPLFVAGPHDAFDAGGLDELVCPLLAED